MKKTLGMLMGVLLVLVCMGASAQDYVSVTELYEQAQAMGGVWQESFDAPNGQVTVGCADYRAECGNDARADDGGRKNQRGAVSPHHPRQEGAEARTASNTTRWSWAERAASFSSDLENDYVNYKKTQIVGYDAVDTLWLQHSAYRFSQGEGKVPSAKPTTYHFPWEIDANQPSLRGSDLTVSEAMRLWKEDIDMCFPGG